MANVKKNLVLLGLLLVLSPLLAQAALEQAALDQPAAPPPANITDITIVRKPGREDGVAQMKVKDKIHKITPHAVQAWPVREGQGALILIVIEKGDSRPKQYMLRYYDLDSGRRRNLGAVPFPSATVQEFHPAEEDWAFALSGKDLTTSQPITLVGDAQAITGVLPGAEFPSFTEDTLTYTAIPSGERETVKTASLLGTSLNAIYSPPQSAIASLQYLQLFPNGTAMTMSNDGAIHQGHWQTDGKTIKLNTGQANLSIPQNSLQPVKGVPAGTRFSVRLFQSLSSVTTKEGMTVKAVSIEPIVIDDNILVPLGSTIEGTVTRANGVGWGFKHETASLTIAWNRATLADGRVLPITARVFQVENSQEKVDAKGKIQGIRSTGTPGHSAENGVLTFAGVDPIAYIFASASGSAVLGFAEPEILYDAGTELILEYTKPLITAQSYPPSVLPSATTAESRGELQSFVHTIPFRTRTQGSNKVSDLTNLVFLGSPEALHRAFTAAGWLPTDDLNSTSTFRTLKTLSGNQTYTQAPMSVLLLDERAPVFNLSKTTNTFSSRHHIRVFPTVEKWNGIPALTASSTQDIGIAFSRKQKTFIHVIDQHIDNERSKVINDLKFTGCVESVDMIPRPWLPNDAFNSTGDRLLTDREVAVLHINSCDNPKTTPTVIPSPPHRMERVTRDTSLTIRNGVYRGNLIYQGIAGGIAVRNYIRSSNELPENYGAWRKTDVSGAKYSLAGSKPGLQRRSAPPSTLETSPEDLAAMAKIKASHKWDPPRYEFALEGGYLHFRETYLSYVDVLLTSETNPLYYELDLYDQVNDGWAAGGTVTINSWKHFSNEFSYFRQQGKYTLGLGAYLGDLSLPPSEEDNEDSQFASARVGLTTRQFEYNLLVHLRPPTSRWRPYIAAGPAFQLVALADAPLKKPAGVYTLGLKNVGLIKAAFDFGNTPPLDGGGIFQFGLQYGGGIKFRATPRIMLRADYRETWSKNPNVIKNSYEDFDYDIADATYTSDVYIEKPAQKFFQDRFTLGIGFAF
jgi:opacity protein-like surface antigen